MNATHTFTITDAFLQSAREYPDNVVFHVFADGWKTVTYREFAAQVSAISSHLAKSGLKKGERAAIVSENRPEWCTAYLSVIMAGGIAVPVDAQSGPEEIRNILADSESLFVFCSSKTYAAVSAAAGKCASGSGRSLLTVNFDSPEYERALRAASLALPPGTPEELASIIYTSGTTGKPKGVQLTQENFCSDAHALIDAGIVTHRDNVLSILPLHHTYAFMCTFLVPVFLGAAVTYPESLKGADMMAAMRERRVTILVGVPQVLGMIRSGLMKKLSDLAKPVSYVLLGLHRVSGVLRSRFDLNIGRIIFRAAHDVMGTQFRFFASGGAKLDPQVMKDLEAFGFTVLEGYGLTETAPVLTFNEISRRKPGSAGRPLPSVELRILNPSETGEGEIAVRGPMVMKGYYRNPSATSEVMRDGWFHTGDIGRLDEEGYLFITGRSKEVIVLQSGKNVYPEDVEKAYLQSPYIGEICVIGFEHENRIESLHAVIVPDLARTAQEQISNINEKIKWEIAEISNSLPPFMRIAGFTVRTDPLPRTRLGKLRRFMIRADVAQKKRTEKKEVIREKDEYSDSISRTVVGLLSQYTKGEKSVSMDDNLELDLGLDSLSRIELTAAMEKSFSLLLPEDFMMGIQTVRELVEGIKSQSTAELLSPGTQKETGWKNILSRSPSVTDLAAISLEEPQRKMIPSLLIHSLMKLLFRLCFRLESKGKEHLPTTGNFILAANHASYLDGFAVVLSLHFSYFKTLYSLGLSDYFTGFFRGRAARIAHVIPIDSSAYLHKALQMSGYVLQRGYSLSVFPEGGRSFDGEIMEFKKGIGILAVELGIPVVPVFIDGAYEALPRGAVFPRFRKVRVIFGPPIKSSDVDYTSLDENTDKYQHFANVLREKVKELAP